MPVWKTVLASCLGLCTLLPSAVRADAALDWRRPAPLALERELDCLALNIYFEARSESLLGRVAVAAVTLNRVAAAAFPNSVCEVVFQGEERGRNLCQFSWRCDGHGDRPRNSAAWEEARRVARLALSDRLPDPTGGALWYHADHVLPAWAAQMSLRARIGHHIFYGDGSGGGPPRQAEHHRFKRPNAASAPLLIAACDGSTALGGICEPLVAPSPLKPAMATWPVGGSPETMALATGLKIDFDHDGLLLCDPPQPCGAVEAPIQQPHEASPDTARTAVDPDLLSLALLDDAIERSTRTTRERAGSTARALAATMSAVQAGPLLGATVWPGDHHPAPAPLSYVLPVPNPSARIGVGSARPGLSG
jgi:N-acetylmuramoyl-L-alanine amidase